MYLRHLCSAWHYITPRQGICQGIFGIFFAKRENTAQYQKVAQKQVLVFVHFASMVPAADSAALPPGINACEASDIFTRSVGAFVHALRVLAGGGVPTPRVLSCFFKSRENVPFRERLKGGFAAGECLRSKLIARAAHYPVGGGAPTPHRFLRGRKRF